MRSITRHCIHCTFSAMPNMVHYTVLLTKPGPWIHRAKEMRMQLLQRRPVAKTKRKDLVC